MNPVDDTHDRLDAHARRLHAASLSQLSPQTLARLRMARHATAQAERSAPLRAGGQWRWLAATAFTAVLAVGVGLQWMPDETRPGADAPVTPTVAASSLQDDAGVATVLDEDPDLYLWLASADAQPLAMEYAP